MFKSIIIPIKTVFMLNFQYKNSHILVLLYYYDKIY